MPEKKKGIVLQDCESEVRVKFLVLLQWPVPDLEILVFLMKLTLSQLTLILKFNEY